MRLIWATVLVVGCLWPQLGLAKERRPQAPVATTESVDPGIRQGVEELARYIVRTVGDPTRPVGIARFTDIGEEARKLRVGATLSSLLTQRLAREKRIQLAETQDIDRILEQIKLGSLGLVDSRSAVEVGKLVGAQIMVSGTVLPAGETYQVAIRINDVATAKTLGAYAVEIPRRRMIALTKDIYNLHQGWYEAPMRSLLLPGWGQMYNGRPARGGVYLASAALLFASAGVSSVSAREAYRRYREADGSTAVARYDRYRRTVNLTNVLLGAGVLLWAGNVVDAAVVGPADESIAFRLDPGGLRLAYGF